MINQVFLARLFALGMLLLPPLLTAHAADNRNLSVQAGNTEKRIALVIGNSNYKPNPLKNPVNDARDIAAALKKLGFEVIEKTDATQKEMNRAIAQFGEKLNANTVALFFYAGHGMQVRGKNYLIPIDAQIGSESAVRAEAVDMDAVLDQFSASPLSMVILDACRNNPFERKFRSAGGGLAQMDAPKGTLIAYATAPGKTAADGDGRNGVYTSELLKALSTPELKVEEVFKRVRANVARSTGDAQIPWEASSLVGDFYFSQPRGENVSRPAQPSDLPVQVQDNQFAIELAFWESVEKSNKPADYEAYLKKFPSGQFAELAKTRASAMDPDEELWNKVKGANKADDMQSYLASFPQGRFASVARNRLDELKNAILLSKSSNDRLSVMIYNVDDEAQVLINGKVVREKEFWSARDDVPADITASLSGGINKLKLIVINGPLGWSYGFKIFRNDQVVFHDECGSKPWGGCHDDQTTGIVFSKEFTVNYSE